ncbi:MAG: formylmethanofuran dehydrogenase subunit C [Gemmatimonadaceae bacterium]|nr:formylmethanofuran dehydrogenase subunit C [Gemmatimonadaceae bacterium]
MSDRITLTLRAPLAHPLAADAIAPDRFASLGAQEISALQLWDGRNAVALGDVFTVSGDHSSAVVLEGDLAQLHGAGTMMSAGTLEITGSIGNAVGARMRGGAIAVQGSAGDDAGIAMTGGSLVIAGNAGDRAGGALQGASKGMTGGDIIVRGSAGREPGARMRRGTLYCASAGDGAGTGMIAGNIIVAGALGHGAGVGNKRGSIVALGPVHVPQSYAYACTYRPPHLSLMLLSLRTRYALPVDDARLHGLYKRYSGDLTEIGKGEILEWQATC